MSTCGQCTKYRCRFSTRRQFVSVRFDRCFVLRIWFIPADLRTCCETVAMVILTTRTYVTFEFKGWNYVVHALYENVSSSDIIHCLFWLMSIFDNSVSLNIDQFLCTSAIIPNLWLWIQIIYFRECTCTRTVIYVWFCARVRFSHLEVFRMFETGSQISIDLIYVRRLRGSFFGFSRSRHRNFVGKYQKMSRRALVYALYLGVLYNG